MAPSSILSPPAQRPTLHRLSSQTATEQQVIAGGPVVVIPERMITQPSLPGSKHSFAASMETAKHKLDKLNLDEDAVASSPESSSPETPCSPITPPGPPTEDKFAFAFDIDGVLIRGGNPIPEAIQAMKVLNGENDYGIKIPYIFLTNGGGKTEAERCIQLSRQLDIEVSPAQFICGHTPMREMAEKYHTVLVVGGEGEKCREVAIGYGFKDIVTPGDIIKSNEHTTPFRTLTDQERQRSNKRNFEKVKIEAIFVFADSRDWASDSQIIIDLAMSKGGYIGTLSETYDEGPPIYFSHNDFVWSAAHDNARLGMGAFRRTIETIFQSLTGKELETIAFGKPQIGTFEFATRLLKQWRKDEHNINAPPETVYFVGDTPDSDIQGTNRFNEKASNDWYSILVQTGVYQAGTVPAHKPRVTVNNVLDAVNYGLKREMEKEQVNGGLSHAHALRNALKAKVGTTTPIIQMSENNTPEARSPDV